MNRSLVSCFGLSLLVISSVASAGLEGFALREARSFARAAQGLNLKANEADEFLKNFEGYEDWSNFIELVNYLKSDGLDTATASAQALEVHSEKLASPRVYLEVYAMLRPVKDSAILSNWSSGKEDLSQEKIQYLLKESCSPEIAKDLAKKAASFTTEETTQDLPDDCYRWEKLSPFQEVGQMIYEMMTDEKYPLSKDIAAEETLIHLERNGVQAKLCGQMEYPRIACSAEDYARY